jgi:hypothetical protein
MMPQEIQLTRDGGFYHRAMAFHWLVVVVAIVPIFVLIVIAVLNPFWFRDDFFNWVERVTNRISQWRNYRKYAIYLGTDPRVWHGLKDQS